jgi:hypothetical protein
MSQYAELDRLILKRIGCDDEKGVEFYVLDNYEITVKSQRLALLTGRKRYQILNGRLQALRKRGAIVFDSKRGGWLACKGGASAW